MPRNQSTPNQSTPAPSPPAAPGTTGGNTGTIIGGGGVSDKFKLQEQKDILKRKIKECKEKGGTWDPTTQTCNLPFDKQVLDIDFDKARAERDLANKDKSPKGAFDAERGGFVGDDGSFYPTSNPDFVPGQGADKNITFNKDKTVTVGGANGEEVILTKEEYDTFLRGSGNITKAVQQAQALPSAAQLEAQQLGGQLGQFDRLGVSPTGLDVGEGIVSGLRDAIPRALTLASGAAVAGATAGLATGGTLSVPLAAGAAALTFVGSITRSMLGNFKSQRTDTTTAQQRVLDEGKQNLNDWATLAASDPANRATYVNNFNQQLALIDQAYRQMKLDTSRDVVKFETALPNLAEFETFYSTQGERDFLVSRMYNSLNVPQDQEYEYQMQELALRRNT